VDILQSPRRPRAIFAASNIAGRGIIPAIQQLRFGMPDDVALLVMDDFEALTLLSPPVSVVSQPAREIAETSWRMLQTLIAGKRLKQRHPRLPATLIVRGSTGSVREGLSAKARRSVVEPYRGAAK